MPSMAFAKSTQARLPQFPTPRESLTTLQASLNVADRTVAPPRFAPGLSTDAGGLATGDLGVSPDRTYTGRLSRTSARYVMTAPFRSSIPTAGRTWIQAQWISFAARRRYTS